MISAADLAHINQQFDEGLVFSPSADDGEEGDVWDDRVILEVSC